MIRIYIVDDHKMVIEGLELLLRNEANIEIAGTALTGEEAIQKIPSAQVDVVLLDINMPGLNGIDTCKQLLKDNPELKVIAISMHKESSLIRMMLSSGAKGYVLKNAGQEEVVEAITKVNAGKNYLDQAVNEIVLNSVMKQPDKHYTNNFPTLSRREKDVLTCILDELTTQEIADKLNISFGTVETHRRNMLIKTGARNTAGLVRIAMEYELLKSD
ncbi:MAG: response regulator transcription factor [Flavobacteriaceae bacterium]|nr:response regulator transcription factor [Flavobacteriaceae bacterium]